MPTRKFRKKRSSLSSKSCSKGIYHKETYTGFVRLRDKVEVEFSQIFKAGTKEDVAGFYYDKRIEEYLIANFDKYPKLSKFVRCSRDKLEFIVYVLSNARFFDMNGSSISIYVMGELTNVAFMSISRYLDALCAEEGLFFRTSNSYQVGKRSKRYFILEGELTEIYRKFTLTDKSFKNRKSKRKYKRTYKNISDYMKKRYESLNNLVDTIDKGVRDKTLTQEQLNQALMDVSRSYKFQKKVLNRDLANFKSKLHRSSLRLEVFRRYRRKKFIQRNLYKQLSFYISGLHTAKRNNMKYFERKSIGKLFYQVRWFSRWYAANRTEELEKAFKKLNKASLNMLPMARLELINSPTWQ